MQRLAGNAAVTRAIGDGRSADHGPSEARPMASTRQSAPGNHEAQKTPDTLAATIQRRVGFEFESSDWHPWRHVRGLQPPAESAAGSASGTTDGVMPVERKALLQAGVNFGLEADDSGGPTRSNLEFVTDPFDETEEGLDGFDAAASGMLGITHDLEKVRGRTGPGDVPGSPPYPVSADSLGTDFVRPAEHNLSGSHDIPGNDLLLSGGAPGFVVKMQSTSGVPLADVPAMMRRIGPDPDEAREEKTARTPDRETVHPSSVVATRNLKIIGAAPGAADGMIEELAETDPYTEALVGDTRDLVGLLAALVACTGQLSKPGVPGKWGFELVKNRLGLLHRNNFVQMFSAVPRIQQEAIRSAPDALVDTLVSAVNNLDEMRRTRIRPDSSLIPSNPAAPRPALASLTVKAWIHGITNGHDYLSQGGMAQWLSTKPEFSPEDVQATEGALESIGAQPAADQRDPGTQELFRFENRAIRPGLRKVPGSRPTATSLPMEEAVENARKILGIYTRLREGTLDEP
ncbi:hypothetical protein GCM10009608_20830 [Pseudonocardia alaniniphila]